jgi:indole-3-glycerol phosphate synthase
MVGVNNRNLRTLQVDVQASETLITLMPSGVVAISESGLRIPADVLRLRALGYRAFLIGERFMATDNPGVELRKLLQGCATTQQA